MRRLFWFLRRLFLRERYRLELDAELSATFELLVAEMRDRGIPELEARAAARRELGNLHTIGEETREAWAGAGLERFARDVRYALRGLRRNRGFALASVVTFALAIGGTTTVGTLVDFLLLRPLPFARSDRIMMVLQRSQGSTGGGHVESQPNIVDWQKRNRVFEKLAYFEYLGFNVTGNGADPQQVGGLRVSHELFGVLRAQPLLGRDFIASDENGGNGNVVILSHALWRDRYASDSTIIGKTIGVNKQPFTVIGVMRPEIRFPSANQKLWIPMSLTADDRSRGSQSFMAIARLRDGISQQQAFDDMRRVGDELAREYPDANAGETVNVFPLRDLWMHDVKRILRLLAAAVALIALMAVVNVAGLLLARGGARSRELGARLALGCSRARLVRQLVTESTVIALLGALVGVAFAYAALPLLVSLPGLGLGNLPFHDIADVAIDKRMLAFAVLTAAGAGIAAGLLPALSVIPRSPAELLNQGDGRSVTARSRHAVRNGLLALEVGLAVVVLVGAGLLVDSVRRAVAVRPGLDPRGVYLMSAALPQADPYGIPERTQFCAELAERARSITGVAAVSAVSHIPLSGQNAGRSFVIEGRPQPEPNQQPGASYGVVCPNYFATMGIPILAGRDFNARDAIATPQAVIVNEAFQRTYFGNGSAVGKRIRLGSYGDTGAPWATIVAVVGDVRHDGLVSDIRPYFYRPYSQTSWPEMTVVVRVAGAGASADRHASGDHAVLQSVRGSLRAIIPEEPVDEPFPMTRVVEGSLSFMRFPLIVMTAFGAVALLLTVVGVFGVASQVVIGRTRELGIRRALGATRGNLYRLVVTQTLAPAAIGLAAGLVVARMSGKLVAGLLYGVSPSDPATFAMMSVLLCALTVLACVSPARRAAGVDPARTLRND